MGSPVTGSSFNIVNLAGAACDALTRAVQVENLNKSFFTWAFNADGSAITPEFAALLTNYLYPIGAVLWWPLTTVPANAIKADGRSLLRAHSSTGALDGYPELFAVFGTSFGTEDITHFTVPDLRGKFLLGSSDNHSTGTVSGEENHQLTTAEIGGSSISHTHVFGRALATDNDDFRFTTGEATSASASLTSIVSQGAACAGSSQQVGPLSNANGSYCVTGPPIQAVTAATPHNNMPPYRVGNWVIKAR